MGGTVHIIDKNTDALVFAGNEIGQEANVDKTKYMYLDRM
jgi:hypothetical protein